MKIRFLLHNVYGEGGGVLTVTFSLAGELAARGHDVEIVSVLRHRAKPVLEPPAGVPVRSLVDLRQDDGRRSPVGSLRRWALGQPSRLMNKGDKRHTIHSLYSDYRLLRYLWSVRSGALVGMQPGINVAVARFGRQQCVRVVQDHRPFRSRPKLLREAYRRYAGRLDAFLTLTKRDAENARKELGDAVPVTAMTNSTPVYTGQLADHHSKVVVGAGRLERSKGFDRLVAAWAQVVKQHPDWELRIFGEGSARADLQSQIRDLGLEGSARLMGFSRRLQEEMAQSSLFVLSSRREGYGLVLVEAMSCGVPVVSFDCPTGPRDIIDGSGWGALVPNNDVDALARAIVDMIELGPERRRELGAAARASANERSLSVIAGQWEQLLADSARRHAR